MIGIPRKRLNPEDEYASECLAGIGKKIGPMDGAGPGAADVSQNRSAQRVREAIDRACAA